MSDEAPFQLGTLRAIADYYQPRGGRGTPHLLERAQDHRHILLRRQPPYVEDHQIFLAHTPGPTQTMASSRRCEQACVHTPRDHFQTTIASLRQLQGELSRRHQGTSRLVMEAFQIGSDDRLQQSEAIVLAVGVKVGVERRARWNAQTARSEQCRPSERTLGHNMHDLRTLTGPETQE